MQYSDITIEADAVRGLLLSDGRRLVQFRVRVLESPVGEMRPEQAILVEYIEEELVGAIAALAARTLASDKLRMLGVALGDLLFPPPPSSDTPGVRNLLVAALAQLGTEQGLRIRLRLPAELAVLPWEYVCLERSGSDASYGFLALDPQIAIVRHEPLPVADPAPLADGPLRLVAALASPPDLAPLDLAAERRAIEQACANRAGIDLAIIDQATRAALEPALGGAEIFHFAGHGLSAGNGAIMLEDGPFGAADLAGVLQQQGVRLALLGGCETGRRDGQRLWSGTAATLVRAHVPSVLAYQFTIQDAAAVAFASAFYQALVGGLPLERAAAAGRLAAYTLDQAGREWGAAVLYLRTQDGQLFGGHSDPAVRDQAAKTVTAQLDVRAEQLTNSKIVVMSVRTIKAANLNLNLSVNVPTAGDGVTITGLTIDEL